MTFRVINSKIYVLFHLKNRGGEDKVVDMKEKSEQWTDDELLKEFEWVKHDKIIKVSPPSKDEFERIVHRIEELKIVK